MLLIFFIFVVELGAQPYAIMLTFGGPIVTALVVANFVSIRLLGDLATPH